VNPYNVENILDHISSCTSKKIILFLKIMVTYCDHLSGIKRGKEEELNEMSTGSSLKRNVMPCKLE
ncbi:hypothetical protein ELY20_13245, partial [Legionella qingyii]